MYIDRINVGNLRGFDGLRFSLGRGSHKYAGWTVFTGDNGSGKSTLLKAIAVALAGKDAALALQPNFNRWIREGADQGHVELDMVYDRDEDLIVGQGRTPASTSFKARISFRNGGRETVLEAVDPSFARRSIWASDARGWFSCGYGPFRRVFGASSDAMRAMVAPSTERFVTMFQEAASLAEVDQWLRSLKHKELEHKPDESTQLELVLSILGDDLLPNQIEVDRVDSDGLWLRDRNGVQLAWSEMSDGYRAAVALLADILRHMIKAYGVSGLARPDANGRLMVNRSGVVLIDEIDAHLHPEWQRQIGPWLVNHFPRVQFLVTTHSPIICQAADKNGLFVLPEPGSSEQPRQLTDAEYNKVIASRPDTILLTQAFGLRNTRSPRAVEARAEYSKLIAKQRSGAKLAAAEKEKLGQLRLFADVEEEP